MGENVKHTPGPYAVAKGVTSRLLFVVAMHPDGTSNGHVAAVHGRENVPPVHIIQPLIDDYKSDNFGPTAMANARLLAAAPDLLAACEAVAAFEPDLMFPMRPSHITPQEWRRWCACLAEIRAAAAKAKGQDAA